MEYVLVIQEEQGRQFVLNTNVKKNAFTSYSYTWDLNVATFWAVVHQQGFVASFRLIFYFLFDFIDGQ